MNIAICIIAYNRINSLKRVLQSLERGYYNERVPLIISIDKSDNSTVNEYAEDYYWEYGPKRIIMHPQNLGLRNHVFKCGDLLNEFDALIVLEDDTSVAPSFYYYAKQCVEKFQDNENIAGISLYNFPLNYHNKLPFIPLQSDSDVYLMKCAQSWGQVWMKKQWFAFKEWYINNSNEFTYMPHLPKSICSWPRSSWLKYHTRYCIEQEKYFVYPYVALSTNNSDAGTHVNSKDTLFQSVMLYGKKEHFKLLPTIKYDGFFENEILYNILGIDKSLICIDFYGTKQNTLNNQYWLTRTPKNNTIIKSYGLSLKPYELNIINNIEGNDIYLCNTKIKVNKTINCNDKDFYSYLYKTPKLKEIITKHIYSTIHRIKRCLHM